VLLGAREEGLRLAERALAIDPDEPAVLYNLACVYALAGEPERALDCLEEVVGKDFGLKDWIVHDHDLASLRGTPRFEAVLARLG
jgi:thioredoxin-like negative regulator of GroEL